MISLGEVVKLLAPSADPAQDYLVIDRLDGQGAKLEKWDTDKLGPEPTPEQIETAKANVATDKTVRDAKEAELILLNTGITVSGITLAVDDPSLLKFAGLVSLIDTSLRSGRMKLTDQVSVYDINDAIVTLPAGEMLQLLIDYGFQYLAVFSAYKSRITSLTI